MEQMITAMTNYRKIPWTRLTVESIAIVGSILVAFAIDAWWEDRQERGDERSYLSSLRQELIQGLDSVAQVESVHINVLNSNVELINQEGIEDMFYFSFITLTTIGYGDFAPTSELGQKIVILEGLTGQFYIAIVMAILVGKFLSHNDG